LPLPACSADGNAPLPEQPSLSLLSFPSKKDQGQCGTFHDPVCYSAHIIYVYIYIFKSQLANVGRHAIDIWTYNFIKKNIYELAIARYSPIACQLKLALCIGSIASSNSNS
jgi:hypothetical protein